MARTDVVAVSSNVTPVQKGTMREVCEVLGVNEAQLVRMALATFVTNLGFEWEAANIKHGRASKTDEKPDVDKSTVLMIE